MNDIVWLTMRRMRTPLMMLILVMITFLRELLKILLQIF